MPKPDYAVNTGAQAETEEAVEIRSGSGTSKEGRTTLGREMVAFADGGGFC